MKCREELFFVLITSFCRFLHFKMYGYERKNVGYDYHGYNLGYCRKSRYRPPISGWAAKIMRAMRDQH